MRFLVDANLSPRVAEWLRSNGHDAAHVFDLGLSLAGDRQIFEEAARGRQILLTSDLDFGEILARSSGRVSVLILRLRSTATANVTGRLEVALAQAASALEDGAVVIVGKQAFACGDCRSAVEVASYLVRDKRPLTLR